VGRILASTAGKYLKPCIFELGGKSPVIVMNDADITQAARAIVFGSMAHSGQVCMSSERILVQRGAYEELIQRVTEIAKNLKAGDPSSNPSDVHIPPLFTEGSAQTVIDLIRDSKENYGAEILLGDLTREGPCVQPHLLAFKKIDTNMKLWQQESFGPVTLFVPFDTVEEAIDLANASDYTLTSSLWTSNVHTAMQMSSKIHAGQVNVNGPTIHVEPAYSLAGLG
jgi:acyl-CoA reductase-like NAD-dependent aldehyde dehydrogenase